MSFFTRCCFVAVLFLLVTASIPSWLPAVPANQGETRTIYQPDGSSFEARLFGDEWAHYYETLDGYTIVRAENKYWYYAELDINNHLAPSNVVVGRGGPPGFPHLRPDPSVVKSAYALRADSYRDPKLAADITGIDSIVVILIEFSDTPAGEGSTGPHTPSYFDHATTGLIFGTDQGKVKDYYDEVSYGQLDVQGIVANGIWHTSAQTELYYGEDCNPGQPCDPEFDVLPGSDNCNVCIYELARDAIQQADTAGFDFAPYDNDGDGVIDHVMIIHAGHNQAALGGGVDDIWSHRWSIPGGEPVDGKTVEHYMMVSEHDAMSILAHEYAHDLGTPDLYDYDGDSEPVGRWCNMAYNIESDRPPHLCGLLKIDIDADFTNGMTGWVTPDLLDADSTYTVSRLDQNSTGSILRTAPVFSSNEYFLVENRRQSGYYDYSVPEEGIIITHVDMDMHGGAGRFNDGTPSNSYHGAWIERPLDLVSSDGAAYSSDDGEVTFDLTSIPNTNANGGVGTGLAIKNVGSEADVMSFDFRTEPTTVSGPTSGSTTWTIGNSPVVVAADFTVSDGDTLIIEAGVVVKFMQSTRMIVNGILIAQGTVSDTTVFTSYKDDAYGGDTNQDGPSSGSRGDWQHIALMDADPGCVMSYCRVRYAGEYYLYGTYDRWHSSIVLLGSGTSLTITNSVVEETYAYFTTYRYNYAFRGYAGTTLEISDCEIRDNGGWAIVTLETLTIDRSLLADNGLGGISATFTTADSCQILDNGDNGVYVGSSGTISNSIISGNSGRGITGPGTLVLSNSQILGNGDTGVYAEGSNSVVTNTRIAGNSGAGLQLTGSSCEVIADTCESNTGAGIYCSGSLTQFYDNVSTGNGDWGYYVPATQVSDVWNLNTPGNNGRFNAIGVSAGTITTSTQWIDEHQYAIFGVVTVADGVIFTLEPGVILKFNTTTRLAVQGTMVANGTVSDEIIFTSYKDDDFGDDINNDGPSSGSRGDWQVIALMDADPGCVMTYCRVRYAGEYYLYGTYDRWHSAVVLVGSGTSLTITNSIFEETHRYTATYRYNHTLRGYPGTALDISDTIIRNNSSEYAIVCSNADLSLNNSLIENTDGYAVNSSGPMTITNCQILNNTAYGVTSSGANPVVRNNRFEGNGGTGLYASGSNPVIVADTFLTHTDFGCWFTEIPDSFHSNYSSGNGLCEYRLPIDVVDDCWLANITEANGGIGITGGSMTATSQWVDDYKYAVFGNITVPHDITLTLESGLILKFDQYYSMTINGMLVANGAAADSIIFTSYRDDEYGGDLNNDGPSTGSPGDWYFLNFTGTNAGCSIRYCLIRYAGRYHGASNYYREAVIVGSGGDLTMTNCTIESTGGGSLYPYALRVEPGSNLQLSNCDVLDNDGHGIYIEEPTTVVTGCQSNDNVLYGFYVHPELVGEIAADNTWSNNGYSNCLAVLSGNISADDQWPNIYTYLLNGSVTIDPGATLTLYKGAVLKFNGNQGLQVQGGLVAQGDPVEKVIFTSYKDDNFGGDTNDDRNNSQPAPGDWGQIWFNGAYTATMSWAVVSYAGYGSAAAVQIDACDLSFSEFIVRDNLDRSILVGPAGGLDITNSDMYNNPSGLENQNSGDTVDARSCWWGDATGPSGVGPGTGDPVSLYVLYDPWLDRSIDNPWIAFTSPSTSGNYSDVLIFDLNEDALLDLIAATEESGLEVYSRTGFETWVSETSPITTGQYAGLDTCDFNDDDHEDLVVFGPNGIRCFAGDGAGGLTEVSAPLIGLVCTDAKAAYVDHDAHQDIVGCSGNNGGIWVFYGDGLGNWTTGTRPILTNSFNHIATADLDNDTYLDIIVSSAEYGGIRTWYGSGAGTWTEGTQIDAGLTYFGLDVGDLDKDGYYDIVASTSDGPGEIKAFLNDEVGGWDPLAGPSAVGIFNDMILADLNGDTRLDLVAASQGGGISVWVLTSSLYWNYWYHPATTYIFNGIDVRDFTLNNSLDLAGASTIHGLALWDNQTPGAGGEYFSISTGLIEFGPVAIGNCAHEEFLLTNTSGDSIFSIVVYTTNPAFDVTYTSEMGDPSADPFDMADAEVISFTVTYCPVNPVSENEVVIIHSSVSSTHLRMTGEGVTYIAPVWSVDLLVENAVGGEDNSDTLTFGGGIGATDSLDISAGEVGLPPLPPSEVFDTRFEVLGCEGSLVNIHDYYAETDSFVLQWQSGSGGYPMTISWDPNTLPDGTFLISDIMGGAFIDTLNMADTNQVVVTNPLVEKLSITTFRSSTFNYDLVSGWHLLSRAVITEEDSLQDLFPGAVSAFTWSSGYVQVDQLGVGTGYWVDMGMDTTASHLGEQIRTVQRTLPVGWSLVGTVFDTVQVVDIQENPSSSIVSIFGFDGGYYIADQLIPGQGYWFDMSQSCEVTITMESSSSPSPAPPIAKYPDPGDLLKRLAETDPIPSKWGLPVTIRNVSGNPGDLGESKTLVLGFYEDASAGIDPELGERGVPPWPPSTVFESRFEIGDGIELYQDIRSPDAGEHVFAINWQAGRTGYPIVLQWNPEMIPEGISLTLTDNMEGRFIGPIDMTQESSVIFKKEESFITGVSITAKSTTTELPPVTEFALKQNVPNPFNPNTTIRFDLPEQVHVKLYVFDVSGRRVKTLVDDVVPSGRRFVQWNGTNDQGERVASGVYFYRLDAGTWTKTRKLVFLK